MKIKKFKLDCSGCGGSGYGSFTEDGFDYKEGCKECGGDGDEIYNKRKFSKGRGYIYEKFEILKDECEHCEGSGKVERETVKHGKGIFGEYRKVKRHKEPCEHCLGEGRKLIRFFKAECPDCEGTGKVEYWGKGLFGKEYKKYKKCPKCLGDGEVDKKSPYKVNA